MENYKFGYDVLKGESKLFEYHDYEKRVINLINDNKFSIILKGRQLYVTTILAAYTAWSMINGKKMVYYNKNHFSHHFIRVVRMMLINYGVIEITQDNKSKITLINGGSLIGISLPSGFTNIDFDDVIYDEAAFINKCDEALSICKLKLKPNGKIIMASTPNGYDPVFFKTWEASIQNSNDYKGIKITYKDNPKYDDKQVASMKKIMNERMIRQEIYAEFLPPKKIKNYNKNLDSIIQFRVNDDLLDKLSRKLIKEDKSISAYLRSLILKDVNK